MRPPNPSPLPDRRIEDRLAVRIPAFARELGRRPIAVTVTDLSEHGCHLHDCDMKEGASVWVEFASLAPLGARVIWGNGVAAGCCFDEPLGPIRLVLASMSQITERGDGWSSATA
jgi:hypothetical protein